MGAPRCLLQSNQKSKNLGLPDAARGQEGWEPGAGLVGVGCAQGLPLRPSQTWEQAGGHQWEQV